MSGALMLRQLGEGGIVCTMQLGEGEFVQLVRKGDVNCAVG